MNTFDIKPIVKFGTDSLEYLSNYKGRRIFIVTDPFMVESGLIKKVCVFFNEEDYQIFSDIVPDPPMELVTKGVEAVMKFKPDVILALGGGSSIDAAKVIMNFSRKLSNLPEVKFIAIPTTSGTGSEVTSFAVITDREKGVKYPLVSDELLPDVAILEPELVKSVPPAIIADTGMDVLTHAIEAYVSTNADDFSDAFAEKAVQLVFHYLRRSYKSAEDSVAKEKMHNASCLAGIAFNKASLGINHAIAHNIGGKLHIPHGRANSILLPAVIEFNADIRGYSNNDYKTAALRYARLAELLGVAGSNTRMSVRNLVQEIMKMQRDMKMPVQLSLCKVSREDIKRASKEIAEGALLDSCMETNPRKASAGDIIEIIHKVT